MARCPFRILLVAVLLSGCTSAGPPSGPSGTPTAPPSGPSGPPAATGSPQKPAVPVAASPVPSASPSPSAVPLNEAAIRLAREAPAASHWQLFVAEQKGFYRKYALNVQTSEAPAGAMLEGLAAATYDVASVEAEAAIGAVEKGANFKLVSGQLNRAGYSLMVGRDIGGYPDLKGKTLAVGRGDWRVSFWEWQAGKERDFPLPVHPREVVTFSLGSSFHGSISLLRTWSKLEIT